MQSYRTNYATIRAGSMERITFTLYSNNIIYNLSGQTICELLIKRHIDNRITRFRSDDPSPRLSFDASRATGKIHFDPLSTTFVNGDELYSGYINVYDGTGKIISFEEDDEFGIKVRDHFTTTSTSTSTSTTTTTSV